MYKVRNEKDKLRMSLPVFLILLAFAFNAFAIEGSQPQVQIEAKVVEASPQDDLFALSLEQLMDVGVYAAATLTEKDPLKTPACITTIYADDIARTPARNLLDLIEIYVPGAMWMQHSIGPTFGIRGFLGDRPYKYLVNINGMNINIKAHYGARLELLNWELSDISRVEIVRGPGSVTYGPGAIGGVINIYTKKGKEAPGWRFGGHYWDKYDSIGNYVSYGRTKDQFDLYAYFSIVHTSGTRPDIYCGGDTSGTIDWGYVDVDNAMYGRPPSTYMADFKGEPEVKAHLAVRINDEWKFWGRYVTSSFELMQGSATQYLIDESYQDFRQTRHRYFQLALENIKTLSQNWELKSTAGVSSIDTQNIESWLSTHNNDRDSIQNMKWVWSEWEYFLRFMFNYTPEDGKVKAAIGYEVSWDCIRPAWGKGKNDGLRLGDGGIMSGPDSGAYGSGSNQYTESSNRYFAAGDGWDTVTHSFLSELNLMVSEKVTIILSARIDKHSWTPYMLSPRAAFIYQIQKDEYIKFIIQRSVRMNTADELFSNKNQVQRAEPQMGLPRGVENKPETLDSFEVIYSRKYNENLSFQAAAFLNKNNAIYWDGTTRSAAPVGLLRTFGLELEMLYKKENWEVGINHSYVKQLSWELADGILKSGVSYSDYYDSIQNSGAIQSAGNNLNNWHDHATKLFTNIHLFEKKVTLHGDVMVFWGMEGREEGLEALYNANATSPGTTSEGRYSQIIEDVKSRKPYAIQAVGNASLTYHLNKDSNVSFLLHNIPIIGENKRHVYSSGLRNAWPDKTSWIEEDMVFFVRWVVKR
ncbi:MAG: TonB-dependent receptor [Sedimentisphaerales bacterium]|nr:TonB-dependent receptor [Sedimentisphaerales bacterium]